jgi:hypothetical protein
MTCRSSTAISFDPVESLEQPKFDSMAARIDTAYEIN